MIDDHRDLSVDKRMRWKAPAVPSSILDQGMCPNDDFECMFRVWVC